LILSTKKNHQQSKKNIPQQKICKIVGLSLYTLMQHQKSKSEFAKFKNEKNIQKSFLPVTYISSHHFQKRKKKMYSRLLPPPLKKSKTYLLEKRKIPKKIFPSLFFCLFFCQITILQNKNIFWCRVETKTCSKLNKFPYLFSHPPFFFWNLLRSIIIPKLSSIPVLRKKKYLPFFAIKECF